MDITKLLENSDPIIAAGELSRTLPGKAQSKPKTVNQLKSKFSLRFLKFLIKEIMQGTHYKLPSNVLSLFTLKFCL